IGDGRHRDRTGTECGSWFLQNSGRRLWGHIYQVLVQGRREAPHQSGDVFAAGPRAPRAGSWRARTPQASRRRATPLRVLDGLDLPGRHVVDPAVDVQLLLLGGPLDEGKLAEGLELEPDFLFHDQPHPLLLRHLDVERPDLLDDPLARLEGVHQPDRNVLVLALVVVERLDPPAAIVTADDDVRDLQVADGELQDGGQVPVVRRDDVSDVSVDEDLPRAGRRDAVDGRAGVGAADPENRRLLSLGEGQEELPFLLEGLRHETAIPFQECRNHWIPQLLILSSGRASAPRTRSSILVRSAPSAFASARTAVRARDASPHVKRSTAASPRSGQVWIVRCDSEMTTTPLTPCGLRR